MVWLALESEVYFFLPRHGVIVLTLSSLIVRLTSFLQVVKILEHH